MSNKKIVIELPTHSNIKNIQSLFEQVKDSLSGKKQVLIQGHISSCDLTLAQLILQLKREHSGRMEFKISLESEIKALLLTSGIKF